MYLRPIIIAITLISLAGCIIQTDKQQQADQIINQFHTTLQTQQWDQAASLFDAKFFKSQSRAAWQNEIEQAQHMLGKIKSYAISSKSKDPRFSGDFYIYTVTVQHEHGFSTETITIVRSLDSDSLAIVGYQIKSRRNQ